METENPFTQHLLCMDCGWDEAPMLFTFGGDGIERCLDCHNDARDRMPRNEDAEWDEWVLGIED